MIIFATVQTPKLLKFVTCGPACCRLLTSRYIWIVREAGGLQYRWIPSILQSKQLKGFLRTNDVTDEAEDLDESGASDN